MNILDKIVGEKRKEVDSMKRIKPVEELVNQALFGRQSISLKERLSDSDPCGIIAEFKRKSPSKGIINESVTVEDVVSGYVTAGAAGISVLTDSTFFGGSLDDLKRARVSSQDIPILRKDFIIDEYQVVEAKAYGADVILLIAEVLTSEEVCCLARVARDHNLEVILEMHHQCQLHKICDEVDIVGINNRNLEDFSVDIDTSLKISDKIPRDKIKISESGLDTPGDIFKLIDSGFKGFLIGEFFMKHPQPHQACLDLLNTIKNNAS
ncbi:MAG: indole-3-glycerol phosphate synthase TrpC [Bacteroidales bacterium]|nr:indole-3-glycerol phosphate synthase TrpC [Bacteroidales bacterium]